LLIVAFELVLISIIAQMFKAVMAGTCFGDVFLISLGLDASSYPD
jgi:hypothetical protein